MGATACDALHALLVMALTGLSAVMAAFFVWLKRRMKS